MARPKKVVEKKAPVKRTRRAVDPEARVAPAPVPEGWVDEQLRKECFHLANRPESSIFEVVANAHRVYAFIKGGVTLMFSSPGIAIPSQPENTRPKTDAPTPIPKEEDEVNSFPPRTSKFDAHTL